MCYEIVLCKRDEGGLVRCVGTGGEIDGYGLKVIDLGCRGTEISVLKGNGIVTVDHVFTENTGLFLRRLANF